MEIVLGDIGRPTLRGVKRCPKCGTYNGTRGFACKNKVCGLVFRKNNDNKQSVQAGEACKLYTGTDMQIYSVRLSKDKGPDYRGFVQLPMVEGIEAGSELEGEASLLVQSASSCYTDQCPRSHSKYQVDVNMGVLQQFKGEGCSHILSCLSPNVNISSPVILRHSAMNDLEIRSEFKHDVYSFAEHISGPLVQRINKQVFVVQCEVDSKHPLGYLHLAFIEQKLREKPGSEQRFFCTCDTFRGADINSRYYTQWSDELRSSEAEWMLRRCIHYYACLCAFASDKKLKEEFKHYLELDSMLENCSRINEQPQQSLQVAMVGNVKEESIGILDLYQANQNSQHIQIRVETSEGLQTLTVPTSTIQSKGTTILHSTDKQQFIPSDKVVSENQNVTLKRKLSDTNKLSMPMLPSSSCSNKHESGPCLAFQTWLSSITETINQNIHFQFSGNPDPIVMLAPQQFFEGLRDRISLGGKKKRLPNNVVAFVRRDALPLGTFTKYTWNISSLRHVQQIFDTPQVSLATVKVFVMNVDGTYCLAPANAETNDVDRFSNLPGKLRIKAHELKTFLRVGCTSLEPDGKKTFDIEWIPEILPAANMGELRIKFTYGHCKNGVVDISR